MIDLYNRKPIIVVIICDRNYKFVYNGKVSPLLLHIIEFLKAKKVCSLNEAENSWIYLTT